MSKPAVHDLTSTGPAPSEALLDVRNLSVEFRNRRRSVKVVDDVSFSVMPGEVLGLVGESGSGKTVTCLGIMNLLGRNGRVSGGQSLLEGRDLLSLRPKELRATRGKDVAMIYQDSLRCLNPAFTVGDQIVEAIRAHNDVSRRDATNRAKELLEMVEIPNAQQRLRDYPYMFSGGMSQRVMLAIALSCSPKLLFADEPTTALDVTVQSQVVRLLKSLQRELNLAIVFITHDLGVVAELADRIAVMYAGQIVEEAGRDDIFYQPTHPYTAGLLGALPRPGQAHQDFNFIPGSVPSPANWPVGCRFYSRCPSGIDGLCTASPIKLEPAPRHQGTTRCVRASELSLIGVPE